MTRYNPQEIEVKWQKVWQSAKTFEANLKESSKPFYNLMMFPYPSGEGLHVGHVYAFGGADTYGHFKKMQGYDVFEPMGFDSFGIHSENYAIKVGKHPKQLIEETTTYFREKQLKRLGAIFDWEHAVTTSDPDYYKWTQWLFIQLFKAGLAVRKKAAVDWCPSCKTVLADEQVIAGVCERCGNVVIQKELEQWFFKITDYAEKLLSNLDKIDWSETTKTMQRNWIGKSSGAQVKFPLINVSGQEDGKHVVEVYTTRPDTLFGVTFLVISPELAKKWLEVGWQVSVEVKKYVEESLNKSEIDRQTEKTGVDTAIKAKNPLSGEEVPVWVADYVLGSYGTGAIMAVPGHDSRDFEFAKKFNLSIKEVISGGDISKEAWVGEGKMVNSGDFTGLSVQEGKEKVSEYIEKHQLGSRKTNYHLRDWLISRQRYWGPPIPMVFCEDCAGKGKSWFNTKEAEQRSKEQESSKESIDSKFQIHASNMKGWYPVPEENLPVELPELEDYQPKGQGVSPLATLTEFLSVKCPECGSDAKRETDVSDTFLDSSWYFLRYPSVGETSSTKLVAGKSLQLPWNEELNKKWLPVDMYIGGNEHAVLHLLYARFINLALHELGFLDFEEPFKKFRALGLIIYKGAKMSKSRGNVINPNQYLDSYGSDSLRMYLLFIGPYDQGGEFNDRAIGGVYRYLNRVWNLITEEKFINDKNNELENKLNKLVGKITGEFENLKFNTVTASLMEFLNTLYEHKGKIPVSVAKTYLKLLAPLAPFTTEELWEKVGETSSVHTQPWPEYEDVADEEVTLPVQINGKLRANLPIKSAILQDKEKVEEQLLTHEAVKKHLKNKKVVKTVYVPGKIVNFVVE